MTVLLLIFNSNKECSFDCTINCTQQLKCISIFLNKNEMKRVPTLLMSGTLMILW